MIKYLDHLKYFTCMMDLKALYIILLLVYVQAFVQGRRSQSRIDTCTPNGGVCIKSRSSCTGYVDSYAFGCHKTFVCCKPAPVTSHPEPPSPDTDECGLITRIPSRQSDPRLRVVGGDAAVEGEWPWQVTFSNRGSHFCGGTLISNQWIVTAAHCFQRYTKENTNVTLGEHHLRFQSGNEQYARIEEIVMHPNFSSIHGLPNDIALIKLAVPVDTFGHYVRTACLPLSDDVFDDQDYCYISGWGHTQGTGDNNSMQHIQMSITSRTACNASWDGVIKEHNICIGNGEVGACQGDSGGPLVCLRDNHYVLAGITSWGLSTCTQSGFPDVYTRVTSFLPWIGKVITE